uniref:Secreted protein n=1 Tax=Rhipicephalus zambeziensis TaxID=60191 RepID=A0A224YJ54_9ACAR
MKFSCLNILRLLIASVLLLSTIQESRLLVVGRIHSPHKGAGVGQKGHKNRTVAFTSTRAPSTPPRNPFPFPPYRPPGRKAVLARKKRMARLGKVST